MSENFINLTEVRGKLCTHKKKEEMHRLYNIRPQIIDTNNKTFHHTHASVMWCIIMMTVDIICSSVCIWLFTQWENNEITSVCVLMIVICIGLENIVLLKANWQQIHKNVRANHAMICFRLISSELRWWIILKRMWWWIYWSIYSLFTRDVIKMFGRWISDVHILGNRQILLSTWTKSNSDLNLNSIILGSR